MTDSPIPDDVASFLLDHIDSIAHLEALLLVRAEPEVGWDAERLARRLYVTAQETATLLERLHAGGFLSAPDSPSVDYQTQEFHFQPGSADLVAMVDRIADIYRKYLIPVTNLIHSKPRARVQEFAEAFKLRKRE